MPGSPKGVVTVNIDPTSRLGSPMRPLRGLARNPNIPGHSIASSCGRNYFDLYQQHPHQRNPYSQDLSRYKCLS